jgi:hypothetical protein
MSGIEYAQTRRAEMKAALLVDEEGNLPVRGRCWEGFQIMLTC